MFPSRPETTEINKEIERAMDVWRAFSPILFCQIIQSQTVSREKLLKRLLYAKGAHKLLSN